ncbi:MAG: hypothetical protein ACRDR6_07660 [Pseudonocardiaceae bacterium]
MPKPATSAGNWPEPRWRPVSFAIGTKRIAPLRRCLAILAETDWTDAIDMQGAQVAVADYRPDWWPTATQPLIRRVRLNVIAQVSADPRSRRRRTLHADQRALPLPELAAHDAVYGYSFTAPRGALSYPLLSREGFGGRSLGLMAYLGPKGRRRENSMPGNRRPRPGVWGGALGRPA